MRTECFKPLIAVFQCYMLLCPCVYGLPQYDHQNNIAKYASCFVRFCNLKQRTGRIDVTAVFSSGS